MLLIKDVFLFVKELENYLLKSKDIKVYSRQTYQGALLLKNANDKKIILKPSNSGYLIGSARIEKFIDNTDIFKGRAIDNYIYIASTFRDNAIRLAKIDKRVCLIELQIKKKEITIFGSMNIDLNLLNYFIEFADKISFDIIYDFTGLLKHQKSIKDKNKPVVQIQNRNPNPKIFFSYSWDNEIHKLWVLKLASELIKSGIDVLIDEWDLDKYNNDLNFFMESGIRESDKVVMICTPVYSLKANERKGGVGVENVIITGEFYSTDKGNKFLPIVKGYKKNIHECLPTYLKSKYSIDFNDENEYKVKFDELIRKILNVPKFKKPILGTLPKLESHNI
jgi:hypothetical protein